MAPAGKCTWMSSWPNGSWESEPTCARSCWKAELPELAGLAVRSSQGSLYSMLRRSDREVLTLSRITSPSCPVTVSLPEPLCLVASTKRSCPPVDVTASPIATPSDKRSARSGSKIGIPTMKGRCLASTKILPCTFGPHSASSSSFSASLSSTGAMTSSLSAPAKRRAAHRQTCAMRRSSDRTPLSIVHLVTRSEIATLLISRRGVSDTCCEQLCGISSPSLPLLSGSGSEEICSSVPCLCKACSLRCRGSR
mmetsp:Transcript_53823/g.116341  ORF Transcript_53823/g.116341 Transcript_53823/m.116341 type:complete len:252 (+) Transcript_53823:443-1198(+)